MVYLRAILDAAMVSLVVGALAGAGAVFTAAQDAGADEQKAVVLAAGLRTGANCVAAVSLVLVPAVLATVYVARRRSRVARPPPRPG